MAGQRPVVKSERPQEFKEFHITLDPGTTTRQKLFIVDKPTAIDKVIFRAESVSSQVAGARLCYSIVTAAGLGTALTTNVPITDDTSVDLTTIGNAFDNIEADFVLNNGKPSANIVPAGATVFVEHTNFAGTAQASDGDLDELSISVWMNEFVQ